MRHRVLVLGGYGFFGERISSALSTTSAIDLFVAGRRTDQAHLLAARLGLPGDRALAMDAHSPALHAALRENGIATVVNTVGPFQNQDYAVPLAIIDAGCNYIDLADSREFVCGIGALDAQARRAGVTVISGASSVPALSMAVIDRYLPAFKRLDSVRIGIASGAKTPGLATVRGIFSYCGKAFDRVADGQRETTHGWLDLTRHRFPQPVGTRLLGSCNVPDLSIIPARYPDVKTATFHAGFASRLGHLVVWCVAGLVKSGMLRSAVPFASPLNALGKWIEPVVSDKGAMFVAMGGMARDGSPLRKTWNLIATHNDGPNIPCGAAIALANKFAAGDAIPKGAMPCVGLLTVEDYLAPLRHLHIREVEE